LISISIQKKMGTNLSLYPNWTSMVTQFIFFVKSLCSKSNTHQIKYSLKSNSLKKSNQLLLLTRPEPDTADFTLPLIFNSTSPEPLMATSADVPANLDAFTSLDPLKA
jgi:hypothetical protein